MLAPKCRVVALLFKIYFNDTDNDILIHIMVGRYVLVILKPRSLTAAAHKKTVKEKTVHRFTFTTRYSVKWVKQKFIQINEKGPYL